MQGHLAVSAGQGSDLDMEWCGEGCWLVLERPESGMIKITCKLLFLRQRGLLSFFQIAQGEAFFPVYVIGMELNLCCFPDDAFHASRFCGQGPGVLKLNAVTQIYIVFSVIWFLWMIQPDVLMCSFILVSGEHIFSTVDLNALTTVAVNTSCSQAKVILDGWRKLAAFLGERPTVLMLSH